VAGNPFYGKNKMATMKYPSIAGRIKSFSMFFQIQSLKKGLIVAAF
jgi:hypothetical protein